MTAWLVHVASDDETNKIENSERKIKTFACQCWFLIIVDAVSVMIEIGKKETMPDRFGK